MELKTQPCVSEDFIATIRGSWGMEGGRGWACLVASLVMLLTRSVDIYRP